MPKKKKQTDRLIKVYLRNSNGGWITAGTETVLRDPLDEDSAVELPVLKRVQAEVHEGTGTVLAYFAAVTAEQRDLLWKSGKACTRQEAMGLTARRGLQAGNVDTGDYDVDEGTDESVDPPAVEIFDGDDHDTHHSDSLEIGAVLTLSPVVSKSLERAGVVTVGDARRVGQDGLRDLPGIGKATVGHMARALNIPENDEADLKSAGSESSGPEDSTAAAG